MSYFQCDLGQGWADVSQTVQGVKVVEQGGGWLLRLVSILASLPLDEVGHQRILFLSYDFLDSAFDPAQVLLKQG